MTYIKTLSLQNFRNFDLLELEASESNINWIIGDNGAGKTSILEAISLMAAGKGIRNNAFDMMLKHEEIEWKIDSMITNNIGNFNITTSYNKSRSGKYLSLDDNKISNSEMSKFLSIIHLTPQMINIFSGIQDRRKFLDRLVYYFDIAHSKRVHRYEYYMRERIKLIEMGNNNLRWIEITEEKLADAAIEIAIARNKTISSLNQTMSLFDSVFPKANMYILGYVEENITDINHDIIKEEIISLLSNNRQEDLISKRTNFGTHRSDFIVKLDDIMPAELCSTGEQKALLISIILAQTFLTIKEYNKIPIILLDEAITHLDKDRRNHLIELLQQFKCQIWVTSTDMEIFEDFECNLIDLKKLYKIS